MKIHNVFDIRGTEFPAGRLTRVIVGPGAPLEAENFVMGYVTIYPGGSIPLHSHGQEEVYIIMAGDGIMQVNGLEEKVKKGSYIYIDPNSSHNCSCSLQIHPQAQANSSKKQCLSTPLFP